GLVEQIFGIAVAIHAARYAHVVPINIQLSCAIGKCKRNLSKADRLARIGAIENDIGHFIAAERLGGLLPEHPAHGIEHVRLAAARSEEHTSELQSLRHLVCRLLLEKK